MRTMIAWLRGLALLLAVAPLLASAGLPATTTLTGLPSSAVPGESISVDALIDGAAGAATGSVDFSLHNLSTGSTAGLCSAVVLDASGHGGCSFGAPPAGGWELVVAYNGDTTYDPASSAFGFETAQAIVFLGIFGLPEATVPGFPITVTAALTTPSPLGPPTGTVNFTLKDMSTGGSALLCGFVEIDATGNASCNFAAPSPGSWQVMVDYSGDTPNAPASNTSFTFSTQQAIPFINLFGLPDAVLVPGMAMSVTAEVTSGSPLGTPTGSVTFILQNAAAKSAGVLCAAVVLDASGNAGCNFTAPPPGFWEIIVDYSGDTPNAPASGAFFFSTQQVIPTIGLTGLPASGATGASTTVSAQVTSASPVGPPTGSANFSLRDPSTGGSSLLCASVALDASGNAGCTFPLPVPGAWELIVDYSGDAPNAPASATFAFSTSPAPALTLDQASLTFAPTLPGGTSPPLTVRVTNSGLADAHFSSFAATSPFVIASNGCMLPLLPTMTLVPGASCDISLVFAPTAVGVFTGQLTINSDAAEGQHALPLSGVAQAPAVTLSQPSLAFAAQAIGTQSASQPVTLTNPGSATLTISSIGVSGDFAQANGCGASLAAGASCTIDVKFVPTLAGTRTGTLSVASNASGSPHTVTLSGTGVATAPGVSFAPGSLTFAARTVSSTSPAQTVTLTNTGNAALAIASMNVTGDFAFTSTCPASLAAGATCTADVTFTPLVAGARNGSLTVTDDAAGSPHVVALSGTGLSGAAAVMNVVPSVVVFGSQQLGATSAPEIVTVSNAGTAPLTFSAIGITGEFSIGTPPGASPPPCPVTLSPGASCRIALVFHPTALNQRNGVLSIATNAGTVTVNVMGTGLVAEAPQLTMASTLDFGAQPVGVPSAGLPFQIRNTSPFIATLVELAVNGDFSVSDTCLTIAAGGACSPLVTFTPSALGPRAGTLTVRTLRDANPYTVSLSGVGEENRRPALEIAPLRVGFGNTFLGQLVSRDITLRNSGLAPLTISGIAVTGDFFSNSACIGALVPGSSCTVRVTFAAGVTGGRNGVMLVTSDAPGSPHRVDLSGTGCFLPSLSVARLGVLLCGP